MKIGAITIGQAPRVDVTADILSILMILLNFCRLVVLTDLPENRLQNLLRVKKIMFLYQDLQMEVL